MPKKGLGQHFLTSESTARKMVSIIDPQEGEALLEIGPGQGALTEALLEAGALVYGIEYDEALCRFLEGRFGPTGRLTVYCQDILTLELNDLLEQNGMDSIRVVGNLPYLISHRILQWLVTNADSIPEAYITLQKEVAQRLTARPDTKEYGPVTITTGCYFTSHKQMSLPAVCFDPRPRVDSTFLKLERHKPDGSPLAEPSIFFNLVRQAFSQRRKMLKNNLVGWNPGRKPLDARAVQQLEEQSGIRFSRRAENLTRREFIALGNLLHEQQQAPF